jgi:hypothetical protein
MKRAPLIRTGKTPIPADPALAGLSSLLDGPTLDDLVAEQLALPDRPVRGCRPVYVRYKPGTSAVVGLTAEVASADGTSTPVRLYGKAYTAADYARAVEKLASKRWSEPTDLQAHACCDDLGTILFAFPNDAVLDGLRWLSHPKKVQRALYAHAAPGPEHLWRISDRRLTIEVVRHKPEKRAVVRVDTVARHRVTGQKEPLRVYLRTYGDGRGRGMARTMTALAASLSGHAGVDTVRPLAHLDDRNTLLVAAAPGKTLTDLLAGDGARMAVARAGAALAAIHAAPLRAGGDHGLSVQSRDQSLSAAAETATTIGRLLPALDGDARALLADLRRLGETLATASPSFVHGDCHHGQFLLTDAMTTVLDYDRSHLGDPLADVGNFAANLRALALRRPAIEADVLTAAFLDAYTAASGVHFAPQELRFWTALGLLQLASGPFREFARDWPREIARLVATAGEVMP